MPIFNEAVFDLGIPEFANEFQEFLKRANAPTTLLTPDIMGAQPIADNLLSFYRVFYYFIQLCKQTVDDPFLKEMVEFVDQYPNDFNQLKFDLGTKLLSINLETPEKKINNAKTLTELKEVISNAFSEKSENYTSEIFNFIALQKQGDEFFPELKAKTLQYLVRHEEFKSKIPKDLYQLIQTTHDKTDLKQKIINLYKKQVYDFYLDQFLLDSPRGYLIEGNVYSRDEKEMLEQKFQPKLLNSLVNIYYQTGTGVFELMFRNMQILSSLTICPADFKDAIPETFNQTKIYKDHIEIELEYSESIAKNPMVKSKIVIAIPIIKKGDVEDLDLLNIQFKEANVSIQNSEYYDFLCAFNTLGMRALLKDNTPLHTYYSNAEVTEFEKRAVSHHLAKIKSNKLKSDELLPAELALLCIQNREDFKIIFSHLDNAIELFKGCSIAAIPDEANRVRLYQQYYAQTIENRIGVYQDASFKFRIENQKFNTTFSTIKTLELLKGLYAKYKSDPEISPIIQSFFEIHNLISNNAGVEISKKLSNTNYKIAINTLLTSLSTIPTYVYQHKFLNELDPQTLTLLAIRDERLAKMLFKTNWFERFISFFSGRTYKPYVSRLSGSQIVRIMKAHPHLKILNKSNPYSVWEKFDSYDLYNASQIIIGNQFLYRHTIYNNKNLCQKLCNLEGAPLVDLYLNHYDNVKFIFQKNNILQTRLEIDADKENLLSDVYQRKFKGKSLAEIITLFQNSSAQPEYVKRGLLKLIATFDNYQQQINTLKDIFFKDRNLRTVMMANSEILKTFSTDISFLIKTIEQGIPLTLKPEQNFQLYIQALSESKHHIEDYLLQKPERVGSVIKFISSTTLKSKDVEILFSKSSNLFKNLLLQDSYAFAHILNGLSDAFLSSTFFYQLIQKNPNIAEQLTRLIVMGIVPFKPNSIAHIYALSKYLTTTERRKILYQNQALPHFDENTFLESALSKMDANALALFIYSNLVLVYPLNKEVPHTETIKLNMDQHLHPVFQFLNTHREKYAPLIKSASRVLELFLDNHNLLLLRNLLREYNFEGSTHDRSLASNAHLLLDSFRILNIQNKHAELRDELLKPGTIGNIVQLISDKRVLKIVNDLKSNVDLQDYTLILNAILIAMYHRDEEIRPSLLSVLAENADPHLFLQYFTKLCAKQNEGSNLSSFHTVLETFLHQHKNSLLTHVEALELLVTTCSLNSRRNEFNLEFLSMLIPILTHDHLTQNMYEFLHKLLAVATPEVFNQLMIKLYQIAPDQKFLMNTFCLESLNFNINSIAPAALVNSIAFLNSFQGFSLVNSNSDFFNLIMQPKNLNYFLENASSNAIRNLILAKNLSKENIRALPMTSQLCKKIFENIVDERSWKIFITSQKLLQLTFFPIFLKEAENYFQLKSENNNLKDYEKSAWERLNNFNFLKSPIKGNSLRASPQSKKLDSHDVYEAAEKYGLFSHSPVEKREERRVGRKLSFESKDDNFLLQTAEKYYRTAEITT